MNRLFKKYLSGTCTPEEYSELIQLFKSEQLEPDMDSFMKETWESDQTTVSESSDNDLLGRIHHRIALNENKNSTKKIRNYQLSLRIAAILIIGLIISTVFIYDFAHQTALHAITQHVSTPLGATTSFQLPDGSMVWLNSGSKITYRGNFERNREIELKGEAFFDVVKSGNAFLVSTEYGSVKVMGTSFDVKAYPNDNFVTTLERGRVEVINFSGKEKQLLEPGNQSYLDQNNQLLKKEVDIEEFISWKEGKLMFVRKSLTEVVVMLERWYNVDIELEANETKKLWFTGTIEKETISEVLELIKTTLPIEYSFNSKTRIMKIRAK